MKRLGIRGWCVAAFGVFSVGLASGSALSDEPRELSREELSVRGRAATVQIEGSQKGPFATGFCINPRGLFVTAGDALIHPATGTLFDSPKVIVKPGANDREVLQGKLVYQVKHPNLAVIRVVGSKREFDALPLGSDTGLEELMDVAAFEVRSPAPQNSAPIEVLMGAISALPAKDGRLERIQFDAPIISGGLGGPLLDTKGRVVGVIVGQARARIGSAVGLAIPVGALRGFLDHTVIEFTPPIVYEEHANESSRFEAQAFSILPERDPLVVELVLGGIPGPPRKFAMTRSGEEFNVNAALIPDKRPLSVRIDARFEDGRVRGRVADSTLTIGSREVRLGHVRRLSVRPNVQAILANRVVLEGPVSGLGPTPVVVGGQALTFDLARASVIAVEPPHEFVPIPCTLIARRAGEEVARLELPIDLAGGACFEAMRAGRFVPPRRCTPITYVSVVSSPGEYLGAGGAFVFRDRLTVQSTGVARYMVDGRIFQRTNTLRGVRVDFDVAARDSWSF